MSGILSSECDSVSGAERGVLALWLWLWLRPWLWSVAVVVCSVWVEGAVRGEVTAIARGVSAGLVRTRARIGRRDVVAGTAVGLGAVGSSLRGGGAGRVALVRAGDGVARGGRGLRRMLQRRVLLRRQLRMLLGLSIVR